MTSPPDLAPPLDTRNTVSWTAITVDRSLAGSHRLKFTPPKGSAVDVTYFRNIPAQLNNYSFNDPFGPATAEIAFPQVSVLDNLGGSGLEWLVPDANVDIFWQDATTGVLTPLWEGYVVSFAYSQDENTSSVTVQCKGAMFQADDFEAYPTFPPYPIPYEFVIRDGLDYKTHPSLRLAATKLTFPPGWNTVVPSLAADPSYMKPYGVVAGQNWTGLTTRTTGSWNKMLTGQIQSLLSLMYTADGSQWTLMLNPGRQPELRVRQIKQEPDASTLDVTVGQPGVTVSLTEDWTQAANVYYGKGNDVAGTTFENSTVSTDGSRTSYAPFAAMAQVQPLTPSFDPSVMRRETYVQFDSGLTASQATALALSQLQRSAHPGYTGSVTLKLDPACNGVTLSRFLIQPGMTLNLHGFKGAVNGLLLHIGQVQVSVADNSVELTVDSKFRDLLTISQVQARTRDALTTLRALKPGSFSPVIQDLRKPWSYAAGSGVIPSSPVDANATALFTKYASGNDQFPWTDLTRKYPPKNHQSWYVKIPPASANFNRNWSGTADHYGIPCLFAETGTIRLFQMAAYDEDGNVMPIRFHASFYWASGINVNTMPMVPGAGLSGYLPSLASHVGQHYPFFPGAFETVDPDGAPKPSGDFTAKDPSMVAGWGNYYQPAGYYPDLYSNGGKPTGLLVDETTWTFDTTRDLNFQQRPTAAFPQNANAGMLFLMVYAESIQPGKPVYFLGRAFRQEPGTS